MFSLEEFVKSPSLEQLNLCRKQDLFAIADQFSLTVNSQNRKADIKSRIIDKLVELNVLLTSGVVMDENAGVLSSSDVAVASFSLGNAAVLYVVAELMLKRRWRPKRI